MKLWTKLRSLFRKEKLEGEMAEEMRLHLDLQTERNVARGMDPDEARYVARRIFGGVEQIKEQARDQRSWVGLEQLLQDFRHAVRALRHHRGFTSVAIVTLALGLGVNAALFSVFNAVALRSLPLNQPEELVNIVGRNELGWHLDRFSYPDYLDLRAGQRGSLALAA